MNHGGIAFADKARRRAVSEPVGNGVFLVQAKYDQVDPLAGGESKDGFRRLAFSMR